jgi:hypothetical protein
MSFHETHFFIDRPWVVYDGDKIVGHYKRLSTANAEARECDHGVVLSIEEAQKLCKAS